MIVQIFKFSQYYSTKLPKFLQKIIICFSKLHNLTSQFFELLRPRAPSLQKIKRNPLSQVTFRPNSNKSADEMIYNHELIKICDQAYF